MGHVAILTMLITTLSAAGAAGESCTDDIGRCLMEGPNNEILGGHWLYEGASGCYDPWLPQEILEGDLRFAYNRLEVIPRNGGNHASDRTALDWEILSAPDEAALLRVASSKQDGALRCFGISFPDGKLKLTTACEAVDSEDCSYVPKDGRSVDFFYRWQSSATGAER